MFWNNIIYGLNKSCTTIIREHYLTIMLSIIIVYILGFLFMFFGDSIINTIYKLASPKILGADSRNHKWIRSGFAYNPYDEKCVVYRCSKCSLKAAHDIVGIGQYSTKMLESYYHYDKEFARLTCEERIIKDVLE